MITPEAQETVMWIHGYGVNPHTERLSLAAQKAAANIGSVALEIPQLTDSTDRFIVVPPLEVQAERVEPHLANGLGRIVCHSQGVWALAFALDGQSGRDTQLTLLAPALTPPAERLQEGMKEPTDEEHEAAGAYGGAQGAIRWNDKGLARAVVVSRDYWAEVTDPAFRPGELVAATLRQFDKPQVVKAGQDERFGPQTEEYWQLGMAALTTQLRVLPEASHVFRGAEFEVARAALLGETLGEPYALEYAH
jgi:hypothetical protein